MKKLILISLLTLIGTRSYSQLNISHIELYGQKIQVLTAKEGDHTSQRFAKPKEPFLSTPI
jgi:hypothetical protein